MVCTVSLNSSSRAPWLVRLLIVVGSGYSLLSCCVQKLLIPFLQIEVGESLAALVQANLGSAATFWGMPKTPAEAQAFIQEFLTYMQLSVSNLYLVYIFPLMSRNVELVGWFMLANLYGHKMLFYRGQEARFWNGFDCTAIGLVCFYYGLSHRRLIGEYIVRYWFVFLFLCSLFWAPGSRGRFDESPPTDLFTRTRDYSLEFAFILLFLTALERIVDDKICREDRMDVLNNWALALFVVHKAIHMLLPSPWNWLVIFSLALPFTAQRHKKTKLDTASTAAAAPSASGA
eukprot:TRINITY_DN15428_c0_g1_i3.p1 TRINITY_DN15428_c0_g1~~TRINITY_DN15428_c0_g1_i3.p1  ORF type:complete len:288 (+),score=29.05 TRINITY_DN15428_c0_g1_i3:166-1029(+)